MARQDDLSEMAAPASSPVPNHGLAARVDPDLADQLLHQFADRSTSAFWILDVDAMSILYRNAAFSRMLGGCDDTIRDLESWHAWVHPEDRDACCDALARVCNGEAFAHDYRIVRTGGAIRDIHETCFPLREKRCAGGICEDVTVNTSSTVYLVDASRDDGLYVRALRSAGYEVKRFDSVAALLGVAPVLIPGCLVLGAQPSDSDILATIGDIRALRADLPLVIVGDCGGNVGIAVEAMKAGAADFLQTPVAPQVLLRAVDTGMGRLKASVSTDTAAELTRARIADMSPRERQVLDGLLVSGTNKSIGRALGLSPRTIEGHRSHIMDRLGARSLADAILMVAAAGLAGSSGGDSSRLRNGPKAASVRPDRSSA
jgi:FixJ family two-component response regulator